MSDYIKVTGHEYEALYAKYIDRRNPAELLTGFVEGKVVLDLCGGTLRVSEAAKSLGASHVIGHDVSPSMLKLGHEEKRADQIYVCDLADDDALESMVREFEMGIDVIVCRQAINYWWSRTRVRKIAEMLRDQDAKFIFNTFHDPPPERMQIRHYEHNGAEFVELIERSGEKIHHLQYRSMVGAALHDVPVDTGGDDRGGPSRCVLHVHGAFPRELAAVLRVGGEVVDTRQRTS